MSFPEESLDLSPATGGPGYFIAEIHQKLSDGKYEIIRKLGYGPRSSTWLVLRESDGEYFAVKIFTIAVSKSVEENRRPLVQAANKLAHDLPLIYARGQFWEKGYYGSHLCVVINPLSITVEALRLEEETQRLPVHVVQRVISCAAQALQGLHAANIMHGAIKADNIYFVTATQAEQLKPVLDSEPDPVFTDIGNFVAIKSQPLKHILQPWRHKKAIGSEWPLNLGNLSHAQQAVFKPELGNDYLSAPETLLEDASCSLQTDIWMLGCMTFNLLTGQHLPFLSGGTALEQIIATQAAVGDEEIPKAWLNDLKLKGYDSKSPAENNKTLEALLSTDSLTKTEAEHVAEFIKGCLRLHPDRRLKAKDCLRHSWLTNANAC